MKYMAKPHLKLITPAAAIRTVTPRRLPNEKLRTREYLTAAEIEGLLKAAGATATATAMPPWFSWPTGTA